MEKKEELRRAQMGRKDAKSLQCHVIGIEAHSMVCGFMQSTFYTAHWLNLQYDPI